MKDRGQQLATIRAALAGDELPPFNSLAELDDVAMAVEVALQTPSGRRWLRSVNDLDTDLAARLIAFEEDFRTRRRDSTLVRVVQLVEQPALIQHQTAIAAGAAAATFWDRLARDAELLLEAALDIVAGTDAAAAESTLYLLVLDPLDPYGLGEEQRARIARVGLESQTASTRSLAAEYLFEHDLSALANAVARLIYDEDDRIRGLAWSAGFHTDRQATFDRATRMLGDEAEQLALRRSALTALGTHLPTDEVVDILAFMVGHPDEALALDAGNLLYRLHRHPTIAMAAVESPHASVREIGAFLLDPYRGSPAAGGSRPGDPTSSDIFAELIRQTEERSEATEDPEQP